MKQYIKAILCVTIVFVHTGCSDFLEVDVPKDQLGEKTIFEDDRMANSALAGVYSKLRNGGFFSGSVSGAGVLMGCYADDLEVTTAQSEEYRFFYENVLTAESVGVKNLWVQSYQQIFAANMMIEGLQNSVNITNDVKNQLKGESLAVRALVHFYLSQTYGSVPYVTSTDYNVNRKIKKQSVNVVIENAINDLKQAEQLLSFNYPTKERIRFNRVAVQALLARLYLYQENWQQAKNYADMVLDNAMYELEIPDKTFLKESKSAILQLKPASEGANTAEATSYSFSTAPAPNLRLSQSLLSSFENNDVRKNSYLKFVGSDGLNVHAYKYKKLGNSGTSVEYSVVLRLEEQFLIASEAAAELNDWVACNERINTLRNRVGLEPLNLANKESAIDAIVKERRVEFFCEYGHRFYDLKRTNKISILNVSKTNWKAFFSLLPIPQSELLLNSGMLPQNNGY